MKDRCRKTPNPLEQIQLIYSRNSPKNPKMQSFNAHTLVVNDVCRSQGVTRGSEHSTISNRNFLVEVSKQRNVNAAQATLRSILLSPSLGMRRCNKVRIHLQSNRTLVSKVGIDGSSNHSSTNALKLLLSVAKVDNFSRANKGEIQWVEEQNNLRVSSQMSDVRRQDTHFPL